MKLFPLSEMHKDIADTLEEVKLLSIKLQAIKYEITKREVFIKELQTRIYNKQYLPEKPND